MGEQGGSIQPLQTKGKTMKYRTAYTRITGDYGIYSGCDYKADHYPVERPIGTAVGPCATLRIRKVPAEFSFPSARWLAEVVVVGDRANAAGERVHVLPGSVGATRDAAVLAAVKNSSAVGVRMVNA